MVCGSIISFYGRFILHLLLRKIRARHGKEFICCIRKKIPFLIKQLIIINIKIINMIEGNFVLGRKGKLQQKSTQQKNNFMVLFYRKNKKKSSLSQKILVVTMPTHC